MKRKQVIPGEKETSASKRTRTRTISREVTSGSKRESLRGSTPAAESDGSVVSEGGAFDLGPDGEEEQEQESEAETTGDSNANTAVTTPSKRKSLQGSTHTAAHNGHPIKSKELEGSAEEEETSDVKSGNEEQDTEEMEITPMRRTPRRPKQYLTEAGGSPSKNGLLNKRLFSTPVKKNGLSEINDTKENNDTPRIERNADRSARRKSTRALIERTVLGNTSDNDEDEEDLAQHIYDDSGEELAEDVGGIALDSEDLPKTPSKRGRPKGSKNKIRSQTPPQDLPPHEQYFFQNRPGRVKTSNNNLSNLALLDHEEYFTRSRSLVDPHAEAIESLQSMHEKSFNNWHFELSQSFSICLFGFGSKRPLLTKFADYIYNSQQSFPPKIVIINGYVSSLTIKDVLNTIASAITPPEQATQKLGSQPSEMLDNLFTLLEEVTQPVYLMIHSMDAAPLRRPTTQIILSRLGAHKQIHLIASVDHPSCTLLWDSSLRSSYNFVFHDCTTFQAREAEIDVVDEVHELLGRSGRRVGGKEGISYVLRSLPENAKNLFRVLVVEQLLGMDGDEPVNPVGEYDEEEEEEEGGRERRIGHGGDVGVEYRVLYQKAVEEFICSNEMNFRTLLKEFHDHQMIESRKDAMGTEMLSVPFRREELETILEDIMS